MLSRPIIKNHTTFLPYTHITKPDEFYQQLLLANVGEDFKPNSTEDCLVVRTDISEEGALSDDAASKIAALAKKHEANSRSAQWLLVFTHHPANATDLATVVCLPRFRESKAVGHNTRGMRFPDAIIQFIERELSSSVVGVVNVNTIAAKPAVRTFFEGGLSGFGGAASSCMTKNLGEAVPLMASAWGKHLQSLQQTQVPSLGAGSTSQDAHQDSQD